MANWFDDLDERDRHVVLHGWGSKEFATWTTSFLLSMGSTGITRYLSEEDRVRFRRMMAQRHSVQHRPGYQPDLVEQLYQHLHDHVSSAVEMIDAKTGRHGEHTVQWLDSQATHIQKQLSDIYYDLTKPRQR
ncbi:MAG: hypothetical protein JO040_10550 [Gemmatimonadetes bacterium]|nr:hypothetical protein [Gemmatimonadota bacterium]